MSRAFPNGPRRQMFSPVRCLRCGTIYDMGAVQTIDRHTDCSAWRCPGCKLLVDDRSLSGWGGRRDIERVDSREVNAEPRMDHYGNWHHHHVIWPPASGHYPN